MLTFAFSNVNAMETQKDDIPVRASELYLRTWHRYNQLLNEAPTLTLSCFCKSASVNYRGMLKWTRRQGLSVKVQKKGRRKREKEETLPLEKVYPFVQLVPSRVSPPQSSAQHQVSITFPDGVVLTLHECTVEFVVTLIDTYERRKSAKEAECSR